MMKIHTYRHTYSLAFDVDYDCNFGIWDKTDGSVVFRFYKGERTLPWTENMNKDTIFAFTHGYGVIYM